jgi:hypothetical protein
LGDEAIHTHVLRNAPGWIQDLSWEELDQFFAKVFQDVNKNHLAKNGTAATSKAIYDYLNARWVDRERPPAILDSIS